MSEQEIKLSSSLSSPTTDKSADWRTEPEINVSRQKYLDKRRAITPDIKRGIYPFKGIKLNRADIEWLLVIHENGLGPVDLSDGQQHEYKGLDLRGADLRGADLHGLPLARIRGGLTEEEWFNATPRQCDLAAVHLEGANLSEASLEGAKLCRAHLAKANLSRASLEGADLFSANLKEASFYKTHLVGANLRGANLEGAKISQEELQGAKADETLTEVVDAERSIVPRRPIKLKVPGWTSDGLKLLLVPLFLSLIGIYISAYLSNSFAAVTLRVQNDQKAFEVKNSLLSKMSTIVATSLTELELIQHDKEGKDFSVVLQNFSNAYRDLRTNGAELDAELSAYFGYQLCPNMVPDRKHNEIFLVWSNYYHSMLIALYELSSNTDMKIRETYIQDLKIAFNIYKVDQIRNLTAYPVKIEHLKNYYYIKKYANNTSLVQMDASAWEPIEIDIERYKYIMSTCILDSNINSNAFA